jgi:hypothetical protein
MEAEPDNIGYLKCKKDKMGHLLEIFSSKKENV